MSHYCQDLHYNNYLYEYTDSSNHSNGDYKYKYNLYLDNYKPNHCESDHGKPDCYEPDHSNPDPAEHNYYSHEHDDQGFEHKAPKYEAGEVHEEREIEYEVYKSEGARYEPKGLEYE